MRYTLLTQVALISVSLVIIFTFIKPLFAEIETTQDQIFLYSDAVAKASQFNARLSELTAIRDSFSTSDIALLEKFLPSEIDTVLVMKDLETIFEQKEIVITGISSGEESEISEPEVFEEPDALADDPNALYAEDGTVAPIDTTTFKDVEVKFTGSYEDLKEILLATESSSTLLEIVELTFDVAPPDEEAVVQSGQYDFTIVFRMYGLNTHQ